MAHPALAATLPSAAEVDVAKETSRLLASHLKKGAFSGENRGRL
jgi:hypothetical protein